MAFYHDAPKKKTGKTNYGDKGSWDEEGTHYTGKYQRDDSRRRDDRPGYSYGNESTRNSRPGTSEYRPGKREDRSRSFGTDGQRRSRSFRDEKYTGRKKEQTRKDETLRRDYRDFEYYDPVKENVIQEDTVDNILCGRNPIREALKNGRSIEKLLVQKGELNGSAMEIVQTARMEKIMIQEIDKSKMDLIAPHHQGLIAYASAYQYSTVDDMLAEAEKRNEPPFLILLDGVTDPHNLGAIIRSAECAGAHGVIVPQHRSVGLTPAAVKASAGAIEHMPVAKVTNINRTIDELKARNIWVYAVTMNGKDFEKVDFKGGTALIIGAEGEGISRLTEEKCDLSVSLPMKGHIDSLNASVAAGIMMYRVLASRRK